MFKAENNKSKKEKTIKSETGKIFVVVFSILIIVGLFTVFATYRGYRTFSEIKGVQIPQFQSAETLKQKSLDIIGIFYLLSGESDVNLQMEQMYRYDALAAEFNTNLKHLKDTAKQLGTEESTKKLTGLLAKTEIVFSQMNQSAREMTISNMEKRRDDGKKAFDKIVINVVDFKKLIDEIEGVLIADLDRATNAAQGSLRNSSVIGALVTILSIFITLGLIRYLMSFLSVTLLPISNLMHNLRQAVFSINREQNVISPVSKYSEKVFETDIVGQNIFDLAFNSLGKNSEAYAGANTALGAVFGEDDIQWSLMEDNFPPLVSLRNQDGAEKILKMTYTPLYQKDEKVQDIMIVAEDVTEFEKVKREANSKQAEVLVIQGLVGIDRGDLESFLADTMAGISQCYDMIGTLETDIESRKLLFRILHTIKGNSRLYNLSTISEVVHVVENSVVEINNRLDNKDPVGSEYYAQIASGLRKIETVVAAHTKTAAQLYGIIDSAAEGREDLMHQNMLAVEETLNAGVTAVFDKLQVEAATLRPQFVLSSIQASLSDCLNTCAGVAKYFGSQELFEKIESLSAAARANELVSIDQIAQAKEVYFRFFFQSPRKAKYQNGADDFFEPVHKLVVLTKAILDCGTEGTYSDEEKLNIEKYIFDFYAICHTQKRLELRFAAQKISMAIANNWSREQMQAGLEKAWQNVAISFHIDSSFKLNADEKNALKKGITDAVHKNGARVEADLIEASLALEVFNMIDQLGSKLDSFCRYLGLGIGSSDPAIVAAFVAGSEDTLMAMQKIFDLIKDGLGVEANSIAYSAAVSEFKVAGMQGYLSRAISSPAIRIDLYKILANYIVDKSLVTEESSQQTYEVSAQWYDQLTDLVGELNNAAGSEIKKTVASLEDLVASLFDYPIKSLCSKMEPMVRDISKRLAKNINFVVTGDSVSMPREFAYALRDALVHMLRNSLDHGIEMPEKRSATGKSDAATIEINCTGEGDKIRVIVRDDGAGINVDKVVAKALAMNMITQEKLNSMSHKERQDLIFLSRLSTKEEVSSLSGRGVGMDAVRAIVIDRMHGSITLDSELGKGTVFTIEIPKPKRRMAGRGGGSEIAIFLSEAKVSIQACLGLIDSMASSAESARKMFRTLHTVKGSATMHNLKGISDMVHFSESIVSNLSLAIDNNQPLDESMIDKLSGSLKKILEVVEAQLKLHKPDSGRANDVNLFLKEAGKDIEKCNAYIVDIEKDVEAGRKVFQILHTMKSNAQMHNQKALADAIHITESSVSNINEKMSSNAPVHAAELKSLEEGMSSLVQVIAKSQKKVA